MLMMDPYFAPSVGTAPGTTTMALGDPSCPPDEPWWYTQPPNVTTGFPSGMGPAPQGGGGSGGGTIEVLATGTAVSPAATAHPSAQPPQPPHRAMRWNPYATETRLRGLSQATPRWGVLVFAGLATFLAVIGIGYFAGRR